MKCPNCGLENPETALVCDCKYNFLEKKQTENSESGYQNLQLAYIDYLKNKKEGLNKLLLFIITIAAFFGSGLLKSSIFDIIVLVCVILFHEIGHFVAMKVFKYTDVKMFFIPFIGAAVSGKSNKEESIKKILISFSGPIPGIALSLVFLVVFSLFHDDILFKVSIVLLTLNVFNLLPIMPLDGGRIVQELFVRKPKLELVFAIVSSLVLFSLALSSESKFLVVFSLFMSLGIYRSYKTSKISVELYNNESVGKFVADDFVSEKGLTAFKQMVIMAEKRFPKEFAKQNFQGIFQIFDEIIRLSTTVNCKIRSKVIVTSLYLFFLLLSSLVAIYVISVNYRVDVLPDVNGRVVAKISYNNFLSEQHEINERNLYNGRSLYFSEISKSNTNAFVCLIGQHKNGKRDGSWYLFSEPNKTNASWTYDNGQFISEINFGEIKAIEKSNSFFDSVRRFYRKNIEIKKIFN